MLIGQSRRISMFFLQTFLALGIVSIIITFLMITPQRYSNGFSYHHGLVNPNHAAHFVGMMLLLCGWQAHRWLGQFKSASYWQHFIKWLDNVEIKHLTQGIFILFSTMLLLICLLLTNSRGGIAATLVAASGFAVLIGAKYMLNQRLHKVLMIWFVPLVLAGLIITILVRPYGLLFDQHFKQEGLTLSDRPTIYLNTLHIIQQRPFFGYGAGHFEPVYRQQRHVNNSSEGIIESAHSNYLEIAVEYGLVGLLLILTPCFYAMFTLIKAYLEHRKRYGLPALGAALWTLSAVHSLIDFPLQIPTLAAVQITLISICLCQSKRYRRSGANALAVSQSSKAD